MIYDETTTEIEIPSKKKADDNIVRIDFSAAPKSGPMTRRQHLPPPSPTSHEIAWFKDMDVDTPWMLRLVAVVLVILLSLLIF